jgi:2-dehydropantoate 2-reductase
MRIAVMGAGGTGGYFRGLLARAGEDVTFIARGVLDVLNGAVVRLGREHGIPTPINFAIYAVLKPYINGRSSSL